MHKRVISIWPCRNKSIIYSHLISTLNLDYISFSVEGHDESNYDIDIDYDIIKTDQVLDWYLKHYTDYPPLIPKYLHDAAKYEKTAMDIIFRWRLSLIGSSHYEKISPIYHKLLRYWTGYILEKKIDLVFISYIPHSIHNYMLYVAAKITGVDYVMGRTAPPIRHKSIIYYFSEDFKILYDNFSNDYKKMRESNLPISQIENSISDYMLNYFKETDVNSTIKTTIRKNRLDIIKSRLKYSMNNHQYTRLLKKAFKLFWIKISDRKILRYCENLESEPDTSIRYIYFPLHWQFEATTLPNGGIFRDQLLAIELISYYLPSGYKLYVREHPAYWLNREKFDYIKDTRSFSFYDRIKDLDNVELISHSYSNADLVSNCKGVATINGSIGFEAIKLNKPVLMFGNSFYQHYRSAFFVNSIDDILRYFTEVKENKNSENHKELIMFLKTIDNISIPLIYQPKQKKDYLKNEMNIAVGLINFLNIVSKNKDN